MENELERGAAQITIKLEDGKITVYHTKENGPILHERPALKGDWDKLWDVIKPE